MDQPIVSPIVIPIVISDRVTAAGFRLAGLETLVTEPGQVREQLRQALRTGRPVLLTADLAEQVPAEELARVIRRARPPLAVIPDVSGHGHAPDLAGKVRRALGVET
ncbi:MAG: hypothetical protein EA419_00465 [Wenzhouxiangella sp.]|nr:MAG: hypothetical protein EA419_00465 [Wenzhouxiangella sp.]